MVAGLRKWAVALVRDLGTDLCKTIQEWIKTGLVDFGFITSAAVTGIETMKIKDGEMLAVLPKNHLYAKNAVVPLHFHCGRRGGFPISSYPDSRL